MVRHTRLSVKLWQFVLFLFCVFPGDSTCARPPNIVLIVADDLGYGDLGCYGSPVNRTPHIDAMAESGLRFVDFHSAGAMCTPTRAAMLTGCYQQRFGREFDGPLSGKTDRHRGLPLQSVTIAELLNRHGYATACFGKWHLGYVPPWLPVSHGFDEFRGLGSGDGDHHTHIDRHGREDWWHNNTLHMEEGYTADLLTRYSIDFMERNQDEPFFLYVPHLAIHFPWQGPDDPPHRSAGKDYEHDKWGIIPDPADVSTHVRAMVESLDQSVGEIVTTIARLELSDRTLIIFTSDNGGYINYGSEFQNISSNGPLRGQKGTIYEGGHRVPMIVSMPGTVPTGVTHQIGHSVDLLPTMASFARVPVGQLSLDGVDLSSLLLRGEALPQRMLFWRMNRRRAVRCGPWKLCVTDDRVELFNLEDDLRERRDLAHKKPALVKRLRQAWKRWEMDVTSRSPRRGEKLFNSYCAACHQLGGQGVEGRVPPLDNSPWVRGSQERLVRIVLNGLRGPIQINGRTYNLEMPAFRMIFRDDEIAAMLAYVRKRYGAPSPPVTVETVARVRQETRDRTTYWTVDELLRIP